MGEFDSKNKGSQVNVYQLIAERNSSTPSKQPSQPREVQPQQSFPQQPQAQPQPAEPKRRGFRVDSLVYFLLIFAILGGIYMRLGGAKDSLAKYEAGQPDIKHEEINNEYFADPDCARLYEVDDVQDTEYGGVEEHVAYTEAEQGDAEMPDDVSDPSQVVIQADPIGAAIDEWANYPDGVYFVEIQGPTYNAHLMVVRDPSKVYMATSTPGNFSQLIPGIRITEAIERENGIAAVNAGAFFDNGTSGPEVGATPEGLVIAGGKVRWNSGKAPEEGFAGFNNDNILVVAKTMTAEKAMELNIRDGCCFGPVLIMNGEMCMEAYNSASGCNPRTAIGQRADGAVLFLCIDGRQAGSLGGTYADIIDIMLEYGAVNACNMDGGSSSAMLYRDTYGLYGEPGLVQMMNSYSVIQSQPRCMPNFWMVGGSEE